MPGRHDFCVSVPCDAWVSFAMVYLEHLITDQSFKKKIELTVVSLCIRVCGISFV